MEEKKEKRVLRVELELEQTIPADGGDCYSWINLGTKKMR